MARRNVAFPPFLAMLMVGGGPTIVGVVATLWRAYIGIRRRSNDTHVYGLTVMTERAVGHDSS
jgi:hypothetical protein